MVFTTIIKDLFKVKVDVYVYMLIWLWFISIILFVVLLLFELLKLIFMNEDGKVF